MTKKFLALTANTNYPLSSNQNGSINYSRVTERNVDDAGNDLGYTIYEYLAGQVNISVNSPIYKGSSLDLSGDDMYPWTPPSDYKAFIGKPLKVEQYVNEGSGNYRCVQSKRYVYGGAIQADPTIDAFVAAYSLSSHYPNGNTCPNGFFLGQNDAFRYQPYNIYAGYSLLDSVITEETDANNNKLIVKTAYEYNMQNFLPSRIATTNSVGGGSIQILSYPKDYTGITAADDVSAGIKALQDAYAIDKPIEQSVQRVVNNMNIGTVNAVFHTYKAGNLQPDKVHAVELNTPVTNFSGSSIQSGAVSIDNRYQERVSFNLYDEKSNVLEQQKTGDVLLSYIWDYDTSYAIAEATNAAQSDIAYTSFEADGKGNWVFTGTAVDNFAAPTGSKAYELGGGNLTRAVNSATSYIVSYWRPSGLSALSIAGTQTGYPITGKTVNGWKYIEHRVLGQSTITVGGSGLIDELRLYPATAQMTTYVYEPLIGVTQQCDVNNRITYYEYDGMGRLILIKDQDRNILKKICYNYAGQAENCIITYKNAERSQVFTQNNCGAGIGAEVPYTVAEGTFTSTLSWEDAQQQAQDDIDAKGQNYANTHGICLAAVTVKNDGSSGVIAGSAKFVNASNETFSGSFGASQSTSEFNLPAGTYTLKIALSPGSTIPVLIDVNGSEQVVVNSTGADVTIGPFYIAGTFYVYGYTTFFSNGYESGVFTRNNCPSGQVGIPITYPVSADTYYSIISQADAKAKALADINANGQDFANQNGDCSVPAVILTNNCCSLSTAIIVSFKQGATTVSTIQFPFSESGTSSTTTIAAGTYTIDIATAGPGTAKKFILNGSSSQTGTTASFPGVTIGSGIVTLSVNNP